MALLLDFFIGLLVFAIDISFLSWAGLTLSPPSKVRTKAEGAYSWGPRKNGDRFVFSLRLWGHLSNSTIRLQKDPHKVLLFKIHLFHSPRTSLLALYSKVWFSPPPESRNVLRRRDDPLQPPPYPPLRIEDPVCKGPPFLAAVVPLLPPHTAPVEASQISQDSFGHSPVRLTILGDAPKLLVLLFTDPTSPARCSQKREPDVFVSVRQ